jgi:hypothetical protein
MVAYLWQDGSTDVKYAATAEGPVTLAVEDANGCTNTGSATVTWYDAACGWTSATTRPVLGQVVEPTEIYACPGTDITLDATSGFDVYAWGHDPALTGSQAVIKTPATGQTTLFR